MNTQRTLLVFASIGALAGAIVAGSFRIEQDSVATPASRDDLPMLLIPVHVSGAVANPGVVWINEGALIADAIALAGGALLAANLNEINLAYPVAEGDHIEVPGLSAAGQSAKGDDGLIDINQADGSELEGLPGVGPVLAARIVAYREEIGRFEAIEDLLEVSGIGESILASLRDFVRPP